mmetsp:Transcript_51627/g.122870  ORF Transcript_51627/g.122870 Transcript_51627/m.122870 type:complete len:218 (-) Transcript_51627:820-1473(-)
MFAFSACKASIKAACAGFMRSVWNAPPALMTFTCKAPAAFASCSNFSMALLVPATVKPFGKSELASEQTSESEPAHACSQSCVTLLRSNPATEAIFCGTCFDALCITSPRFFTSFKPVSKLNTPAAYKALYSPSERPATACTLSTRSGLSPRSFSMAAALAVNMAGWQTLVASSSSSGPSKHFSRMLKSRMSSQMRRRALTSGSALTSFSMVTYWEP